MVNMQERSFQKDDHFAGSVTEYVSKGGKLILLDMTLEGMTEELPGNSFLQEVLPIDKDQKFQDGVVAIGLGRWMKTLLLSLVTASTSERDVRARWFRALVALVAKLTRLRRSDCWFDVARETIRQNDKVEDILVIKLLQAVLREKTTCAREFRWFETSMHRALKHSPHRRFRDNVLVMVVWLFADAFLTKGMSDMAALDAVFAHLATLSRGHDVDVLRFLLETLFPSLVPQTASICAAIHAGTPWHPAAPASIRFADKSEIRSVHDTSRIGVCGGTLTRRDETGEWYDLSTMEYNHFTVVHVPRGATEMTLRGTPMPPDRTSKHGAAVLVRGHSQAPKTGKAFLGVMGLSLAGGRGDGKSAPTVERTKPSVLTDAETAVVTICTIRVHANAYEVAHNEWTTPLSFPLRPTDTVLALYVKGFKNLCVGLADRSAPVVVAPTERGGTTLAEMMAATPLQALQCRVDAL